MDKSMTEQKHAYTRSVGSQSEEPSIAKQADGSSLISGYQNYRVDEKGMHEAKHEHELKYNAIRKHLPFLEKYNFIDIGCSSGYFGTRALLDGVSSVTFLDHDPEYLVVAEKALKILGIKNYSSECIKLSEYEKEHDVGFCLALIHWIYSYSEKFGSLYSAIEHLSKIAKHSLFIEWVDTDDYAVQLENHIGKNAEIITSEYNENNFIGCLKEFYKNVLCIEKITSTRYLYLATNSNLDLLGFVYGKDKAVSFKESSSSSSIKERSIGGILVRGNTQFRESKFEEALETYRSARSEYPELAKHIDFNISLVEKRLERKRVHTNRPKVPSNDILLKPEELSEYYFNKIVESDLFDQSWYLEKYQNRYKILDNSLSHYFKYGLENGLNPSSSFDTLYYIESNPDLANSDLHPFIHFIVQGSKEGRSPLPAPDLDLIYPVVESVYVPRLALDVTPVEKSVRVIAIYLPQFHPIPENNAWWGSGFTEWTNVRPAKPQFEGHYQPHVPDDYLGYYDLRDTEIMGRQIDLAKQYGVEGFCFYTYWFSGARLLEAPVDNYLADASLGLPFCICWANENWSRRWDGLDKELLMVQHYSEEDDIAFITHMSKYLRDPRYICIEGKPLLIVYRPNLFPSMKETAHRWRAWCLENGLGEIYIAYVQSFEKRDPADYGLDAAIEFPPNNSDLPNITNSVTPLVDDFEAQIYDWRELVERSKCYEVSEYTIFRGVNPSWDNTARRKNKGSILLNSTPHGYQEWLLNAIADTRQRIASPDERMVFINAWNEWAEGAHLEPDKRDGFAYLEATRMAQLRSIQPKNADAETLAVVVHAFYEDVFAEIMEQLNSIKGLALKLFVTTPHSNIATIKEILSSSGFPYLLMPVNNRGRDVLPFLKISEKVADEGYTVILKIHTKKSKHREDGDVWRNDLYAKLLNENSMRAALHSFNTDADLGVIGPSGHIVPMSFYWGSNAKAVVELSCRLGLTMGKIKDLNFVAGTMFFARMAALEPLFNIAIDEEDFELEEGQIDGTLAHAIERVIAISASSRGYRLTDTELDDVRKLNQSYSFAS
jgi:lipopolysaccharide biosynthesis protein/2-polyprenyl-3-methyl-5-hydroxy-6-metoxy-1,4-benzoquinol methylase